MIIYNIENTIKKEIEEEWLEWMKTAHIPAVMKTGYFNNHRMLRIVIPKTDETTVTYINEYECESLENYLAYSENDAPRLRKDSEETFKGKFTSSRTVTEVI